jgi:hypothetical protein
MFKKEIMWPASNSQQKSAEQKFVKDGAMQHHANGNEHNV